MMKAVLATLLFVAGPALIKAQVGETPIPKFDTQAGDPLMEGNAVTISPDGLVLYVTRSTGVLDGLNPADGATRFSIDPATAGAFGSNFTCKSGISVFGGGDAGDAYVTYGVNADGVSTSVIAVSHPGGAVLWATDLDGTSEGTPQVGNDGQFIYVTHNDGGVGQFTVLNNQGETFYSYEDTNNFAYGAPGIYRNPAYGNYPGGVDLPNDATDANNQNDLLVWSATSVPFTNANGQLYGFQLPVDFAAGGDSSDLEVQLFATPSWQSTSPPGFAKEGTEMYWGVTRNEFRGWAQVDGSNARFTNRATVSTGGRWERGETMFADPPAAPILNSAGTQLFCGLAIPKFVALDPIATTKDMPSLWELDTTAGSLVTTNAVLWPIDESVVFWAESNPGIFHATIATNGSAIWDESVDVDDAAILSEYSISPDGATLYFGLATGEIHAWTIFGDGATGMPSATPMPSSSETGISMPSSVPTGTPSPSVTLSPSFGPSTTPGPSMTSMPSVLTESPTQAITAAPSEVTTTEPGIPQPGTATPTVGGPSPTIPPIPAPRTFAPTAISSVTTKSKQLHVLFSILAALAVGVMN